MSSQTKKEETYSSEVESSDSLYNQSVQYQVTSCEEEEGEEGEEEQEEGEGEYEDDEEYEYEEEGCPRFEKVREVVESLNQYLLGKRLKHQFDDNNESSNKRQKLYDNFKDPDDDKDIKEIFPDYETNQKEANKEEATNTKQLNTKNFCDLFEKCFSDWMDYLDYNKEEENTQVELFGLQKYSEEE